MEVEEDPRYRQSSSPYDDVLNALMGAASSTPGKNNNNRRADPRALKLAAVASALVELVDDENGTGGRSASKVYAKAVAALEGTLRGHPGDEERGGGGGSTVVDSLWTQVALLEMLEATVPHVEPPAILTATLPLASRVLVAVVASVRDAAAAAGAAGGGGGGGAIVETNDELGGANAVLRRSCRVATEVLLRVSGSGGAAAVDERAATQLFGGVILALFHDRRPKVRKVAHGSIAELLRGGGGGGADSHDAVGAGSSSRRCHPAIKRAVNRFAHSQLSSARRRHSKDGTCEQLGDCLHLLGFLEQAILDLDYIKLGGAIMELFAVFVGNERNDSSVASNFVDAVKVKEATPTVLAVSGILSTITAMLKDASKNMERKRALDDFAPRVLASLLQASPSLIFRNGMADFDLLQRGRTLYGQAVITSCDRVAQSKPDMACRLMPLSIQMVMVLSKPADEDPDDASVAEVLMVEATQLFRSRLPPLIESSDAGGLDKCLNDTVRALEMTMEATLYRPTWPVSLQSLVVLLQLVHGRQQLAALIGRCVSALLELRNEVPAGSPSQHTVEAAFSSLVQGVGIEVCWGWIRWHPSSKSSTHGEFLCWNIFRRPFVV